MADIDTDEIRNNADGTWTEIALCDLVDALRETIDRYEQQADLRIGMIAELARNLVKSEEKIEKVRQLADRFTENNVLRETILAALDADDD